MLLTTARSRYITSPSFKNQLVPLPLWSDMLTLCQCLLQYQCRDIQPTQTCDNGKNTDRAHLVILLQSHFWQSGEQLSLSFSTITLSSVRNEPLECSKQTFLAFNNFLSLFLSDVPTYIWWYHQAGGYTISIYRIYKTQLDFWGQILIILSLDCFQISTCRSKRIVWFSHWVVFIFWGKMAYASWMKPINGLFRCVHLLYEACWHVSLPLCADRPMIKSLLVVVLKGYFSIFFLLSSKKHKNWIRNWLCIHTQHGCSCSSVSGSSIKDILNIKTLYMGHNGWLLWNRWHIIKACICACVCVPSFIVCFIITSFSALIC